MDSRFIEAASAKLDRSPETSITSIGSSLCAIAGRATTVPSMTDTALFTIDCLNGGVLFIVCFLLRFTRVV